VSMQRDILESVQQQSEREYIETMAKQLGAGADTAEAQMLEQARLASLQDLNLPLAAVRAGADLPAEADQMAWAVQASSRDLPAHNLGNSMALAGGGGESEEEALARVLRESLEQARSSNASAATGAAPGFAAAGWVDEDAELRRALALSLADSGGAGGGGGGLDFEMDDDPELQAALQFSLRK